MSRFSILLAFFLCCTGWAGDNVKFGLSMGIFEAGADASAFSTGFFFSPEVSWKPAVKSPFDLAVNLDYGALSEEGFTDLGFWTVTLAPRYSREKFAFFGGAGYGEVTLEDNLVKNNCGGLVLLGGVGYHVNTRASFFVKHAYFVEDEFGSDSSATFSSEFDVSVTQLGFKWSFGQKDAKEEQKKRRTIPISY